MARMAAPSPACRNAGRSRASPRRSRCGTPTSYSRSTSSRGGRKCRTARIIRTASARSGRCSCATWWARRRASPGTSWPAQKACNWRRRDCAAGASAAGSTSRSWRRDMPAITLPTAEGLKPFTTSAPRTFATATPPFPRVALAAAHVVADPLAEQDPWLDAKVDWDRTIAFRRHLWSLGLGVAEAMDTAQRGMGLDWVAAQELIRRSLDAMQDMPGAVMASGAGTDHLAPGPDVTIDDVIRAYEEQCAAIERMDGRIILMASRALAKAARGPADYERVYARILSQVRQPVIIHWLGRCSTPRSMATGARPTTIRRWRRRWR